MNFVAKLSIRTQVHCNEISLFDGFLFHFTPSKFGDQLCDFILRTSNHRNQLSIDSNQLSLSRYSRRSKPLTNAIVVFVAITFDPLSSINSVELVDHLLHSYICSIDMIIIHNQNQKAIATDTKEVGTTLTPNCVNQSYPV